MGVLWQKGKVTLLFGVTSSFWCKVKLMFLLELGKVSNYSVWGVLGFWNPPVANIGNTILSKYFHTLIRTYIPLACMY